MMPTGIFYHPDFLKHDMGFGHPESPKRLSTVMEFLTARRVFDNAHISLLEPSAITQNDLERVHPKDYIDLIHNASDREARLDADTRTSKGSYNAALLAAGAGINAWEEIQAGNIDNAFALVRPPGHHANAQSARGFCLFNNISVLAEMDEEETANMIANTSADRKTARGFKNFLSEARTKIMGLNVKGTRVPHRSKNANNPQAA